VQNRGLYSIKLSPPSLGYCRPKKSPDGLLLYSGIVNIQRYKLLVITGTSSYTATLTGKVNRLNTVD